MQLIQLEKNHKLPVSNIPYRIVAKDGLWLYSKSILGRSITKEKYFPEHLGEVGAKDGIFQFEAPLIPAELCAQIVHFFRRIFEKYKAEASVTLTYHIETNTWRAFIPTQEVGPAAVEYVFEPEHIKPDHLIVGTMHSHCDFSAFHSGTDESDANKRNGIHFTIGKIKDEKPHIACMVAVNGEKININKIEDVADFSNLDAGTAPEWWDQYVTPNNSLQSTDKPVGFQNFQKYTKPVVPSAITPYKAPLYAGLNSQYGWWDDDGYYSSYQHSYNKNNSGWRSNNNWKPSEHQNSSHWEDFLDGLKLRDLVLDSGVITDDDLLDAALAGKLAADTMYWRMKFIKKMKAAQEVLEALGIGIEFKLGHIKIGEQDHELQSDSI